MKLNYKKRILVPSLNILGMLIRIKICIKDKFLTEMLLSYIAVIFNVNLIYTVFLIC